VDGIEISRQAALQTEASARWTVERVLEVRYWTPTLLSFRTTRYRGFRFTPGHYARLGLAAADGTTVWRSFSLVSAAHDEHLEFLAVLVPGGAFSTALATLKVGDSIQVEKACFGFLTLDQLAPGRDLWLLASGTGIGPYLSILHDPSVWQRFENLVVVHSVRRAEELAYREEILGLKERMSPTPGSAELRYVPVVTREPGATPLHARIPVLITDGRLGAAAGRPITLENSRLMVCGNPELASELRAILRAMGFTTTRRGLLGQMAFEKYW